MRVIVYKLKDFSILSEGISKVCVISGWYILDVYIFRWVRRGFFRSFIMGLCNKDYIFRCLSLFIV